MADFYQWGNKGFTSMKTCCLIPTFYRPAGLKRVLSSLRKTAPSVDICVISERDDFTASEIAFEYDAKYCFTEKERQGCIYAWNECLKAAPDYPAYFLAADDNEFMPNWHEECLKVLKEQLNNSGFVGINDKRKDSNGIKSGRVHPTAYLMTRDFIIDYVGGVVCIPHYTADWTDVEISLRARKANKFAYAQNAIVIHHWRSAFDLGYQLADRRRAESHLIFQKRYRQGFPDDFEPILKKEISNA